MQFKFFDILSNLIPGFVVTIVLTVVVLSSIDLTAIANQIDLAKSFSSLLTTAFLVISFLTGYFIHMIGSRIEPILWWSWGGRPSKLLLKREIGRMSLSQNETDKILKFLIEKCQNTSLLNKGIDEYRSDDLKELFQTAKHLANLNAKDSLKERLNAFSGNYIFSRNILVAFLIVFLIISAFLVKESYYNWIIPSCIFIIILMSWSRCRERAIYYSREIIVSAFYTRK